MDSSTFADLLARAKRGDDSAFAALFRNTQPAVLRYLSVLANARAEDLAGDTWLQVIRGLDRFTADEPAAFRAWVLSIARHRWLDDLRSRGRRPESVMAELPEQHTPADAGDEALELISTERAIKLIAGLPRQQAEVVFLRYVADLGVQEIAQLVSKEPGAVRVLAHRGLTRLRQTVRNRSDAEQV